MSIFSPSLTDNNAIGFPFGLQFKLIQVFKDGHKSEVMLIRSADKSVFYGLFDVEDVDFEVVVDNECAENIRFHIKLENCLKKYCLSKWSCCILKALETNGRHLHFVSQRTEEGKLLLALSAHRNEISVEEAAIDCSRIGFAVEIETKESKRYPFPTDGKEICIFIKRRYSETPISFYVKDSFTTEQIRSMLKVSLGIPEDQQRIIFGGRQLEDGRTLSEYGISDQSTIHLVLSLKKGNFIGSGQNIERESPNVKCGGERCLVCTRPNNNIRYQEFVASTEFDIKPFIIELRVKPKYSLN